MRVAIPTLRELLALGLVAKADEYSIKSLFRCIGRPFPQARAILYDTLENFDCFVSFEMGYNSRCVTFESVVLRDHFKRVADLFREWRQHSEKDSSTQYQRWYDNVPKPAGQSRKYFENPRYKDTPLPYRIRMSTWWYYR
jgi:hypothetical protein